MSGPMARFVRTEKAPEDDDARQTWLANRTEAQINADVATGDHRKRMRLDAVAVHRSTIKTTIKTLETRP